MRYTERTVSTKHPSHGKLEIVVQVPQVESLDEYRTFVGADDKALDFVNGAIATGAVNGARASARNAAETASVDDISSTARTIARGYVPTGADRGPSKKEKLATFDAMMARVRAGETVSTEELESLASKFGA